MVTYHNGPGVSYTTTNGGNVSTAEQIDKVVAWVDSLETWNTPLYNEFKTNESFDNETHQWGQSYQIELDTVLNGAVLVDATTFKVPAGLSGIFQERMIVEVANPTTTSNGDIPDPTNAEQVQIASINRTTDTITLAGKFAKAHADGALVAIVGIDEKQNSEHTEAPWKAGQRFFNYPQRQQAKMTADKRDQNQPTWENPTNRLIARFNKEIVKQKVILDRQITRGKRQAETATQASRFGGLNEFLTTNVVNLAGAALTPEDLEDILVDLWYTMEQSAAKKLYMSMNTARIWDQVLDPVRRATVKDDELNTVIRRYTLRTGTYDIQPTHSIPEGEIYILDPSLIKLKPFNGLDWHKSGRDGEDFAVDHDVKAISGDFTLEVRSEHAMARIYNFDNRLATYSS